MVVNINAEISNYKERVIGNYTLRQIICLLLSLIVGVVTYFYLDIQKDIKQFMVIVAVLPIVAVGFYTYQGVTCEVYMYHVLKEFFLPQKRPFKVSETSQLIYEEVDEENDKKTAKQNKKRKAGKI